jgi:hypothetical protein
MKKVKRLDFKLTDKVKSQCGTVAQLYIDGKNTLFNAGHDEEMQYYRFDDEINIKEYPQFLDFKISDIANKVHIYIGINRKQNDILYWLRITKLKNILTINYLFNFDDENKFIKCGTVRLWHRLIVELENINFTEIRENVWLDEGGVGTKVHKTYTNPSLILGDLIKADIKIIDAVIKKVNK